MWPTLGGAHLLHSQPVQVAVQPGLHVQGDIFYDCRDVRVTVTQLCLCS